MVLNNILILVTYASLILMIVGNDRRIKLASLSIVYLLAFIIIIQVWPVALASVKLISGWMGVILIGASQISHFENKADPSPASKAIFQLLITALVWIVITAEAAAFNEWIPIPYANLYLGLVIIAGGLINASVNQLLFDVIIGVLTLLAGFDIIYSSLEGSALVTGIFALMIILISLLSNYFSASQGEIAE